MHSTGPCKYTTYSVRQSTRTVVRSALGSGNWPAEKHCCLRAGICIDVVDILMTYTYANVPHGILVLLMSCLHVSRVIVHCAIGQLCVKHRRAFSLMKMDAWTARCDSSVL